MSKKSKNRVVGGGALDAPAAKGFVFLRFRSTRNISERDVEGAVPYNRFIDSLKSGLLTRFFLFRSAGGIPCGLFGKLAGIALFDQGIKCSAHLVGNLHGS